MDRVEVLSSSEEEEVEIHETPAVTVDDASVALKPNEGESKEAKSEPLVNSWDADRVAEALVLGDEFKSQGNGFFQAGNVSEALGMYTRALVETEGCEAEKSRSVYFGNRAQCHLADHAWDEAESDCNAALKIDPEYKKCLLRRASARENLDKLSEALSDYKLAGSSKDVRRLEPIVKERQEKQQKEMMDQLKGLGNTLLGKFGLSLDNFNLQKDDSTGSYSVQFDQGEKK